VNLEHALAGAEVARRRNLLRSASISELKNSKERLQLLQMRWKCRG
jgi:hypothetical protein